MKEKHKSESRVREMDGSKEISITNPSQSQKNGGHKPLLRLVTPCFYLVGRTGIGPVTNGLKDIKYLLEHRFGWGKVDKIEVGGKIEQEHEHHNDMEIGPALREVLEQLGVYNEQGTE